MPPRKSTKDYQNEIIRVHYGINNQTLGVQSVWETRGGKLASMSGGRHFNYQVVAGSIVRSDAVSLAFDLTDVITLPVDVENHPLVNELETKASIMRAQRST
ncbi:hypothetical protein PYH37_000799 [Sinorhizobium numidicum]|uniref:Uncharacterized protein n=1 Tax=Sinorhizobium numidicum TaxID=680248 RepID=A0ABY8CXD2_9HYPH|nr:hypothetical protein [Sinorhizobium numidicum]WEX75392.1 hypothetical protein PYH37_000799 [Sinorhizobium numidicum]WEX81388.1 hypothetical protein PYH38_000800 [Sinorhizobium numidicum]